MGKIISQGNFTGRYLVAKTSYNTSEIESYIDTMEPVVMAQLLGADLATAFLNNIIIDGAPPSDPLFLTLYNPLQFNSSCGELYYSAGMKNYVLGIIYWHYMIEQRLTPSITAGVVQNANENSEPVESRHELTKRYNDSIGYSRAIQKWCCDHKDDYPTFKGSNLHYNWPT